MPDRFTCPQGHQWESAGEQPYDPTSGTSILCPVCSASATLSPPPADLQSADTQLGGAPPASSSGPLPAIPGYEVLGELGRGGMGVVYRARQVKLNRLVALKMILSGAHAGPQELARFRSEAEAVARLQHPNIVQVYEVGEHQGLPFFSLEFCPGGSLDKKLAGTPMPPQQAAALVQVLARAMHAAHQRRVVHRDLKPANVLLADDGTPKVTDFGLAKKLDEAGQTHSGAVMGTPSYMAPEQAAGKIQEVGPAADEYALGALLYECLTGRPPFKAATAVDTLMQVVHQEPVPPRQLNPAVPRDLETVCLKCLEKDRGRRYGTAQELADELGRFLAGQEVRARPVGAVEHAWRWCRRNRVVATLLLLVAILLSLGIGAGTYSAALAKGRTRLEKALEEARDARGTAEAEKERADGEAREARRQKATAELASAEAERQKQRAEQFRHVNQLHLANREWESGNVPRAQELLETTRKDFRGWEYDYLNTLINDPQRTLRGHTDGVTSVCFRGDGRRLVSGSADRTVKVWDTHTGQEVLSLKGHTEQVNSVAVSGDGKRIASGGKDQTVRLWDAATGREILTLKGHTKDVSSVAFSPDGKRLASASFDGTVRVWDAATGREAFTLKGHAEEVHSVAFSPDGKRLASAGADRTVRVWDAATGREVLSLTGHTGFVFSVAFSPEGGRLASGGDDRMVRIWDARTGNELLALKGHTSFVFGVTFSPDGRRLASASFDQTVRVWDAWTGQEALALKGHTGFVFGVAFSPDGKCLASGGALDQTVKVWDAAARQQPLTLKGHTGPVSSVAFSPDGKRLVSGGDDQTVRVWDAAAGQEILTLKGHTEVVNSVAVSGDGRCIASGSKDQTVRLWDAATGREVLTLKGHTKDVLSVAFSPDGKRLASASQDKTVKVWDARTGQEAVSLTGHTGDVFGVCFSPDGKRLASAGGGDRTVRIWDAVTGREILTLNNVHDLAVSVVAFSPDGSRLASAGLDGTVRVREARTGRELLTLKGHAGLVHSVAFSPDGRRLVSGGDDRTVRVWDAAFGQEVLSLRGHANNISGVAFNPDGKSIASGSWDQTVKVWGAAAGPEVLSLRGHTDQVSGVAFSPDSKRLISTDSKRNRIVWDLSSGKPLPGVQEPDRAGEPVSPDGRWFAYADGTVIRLVRRWGNEERPRLQRLTLPDPAWHDQQARQSEGEMDWFAAAFHLARLARLRPWDSTVHMRRAHVLARLGRAEEAALSYLSAVTLSPHVSLWPLDPGAAQRGAAAATEDEWPRAVEYFQLAAHQPGAPVASWRSLLLVQRAASQERACRQSCQEMLDRFESARDLKLVQSVAFACRTVPCGEAAAGRVVRLAERVLADQRNASNLDLLGAALYRASRFKDAAQALEEAIKAQGKGGYIDSWLFLAMARKRLGQPEEARRWLLKVEDWLKDQKFEAWETTIYWRLLHQEARGLILKMPRAEDGQ
jgi:WD40 repeat protein/tetratricopeptide (TPR) repeat protein